VYNISAKPPIGIYNHNWKGWMRVLFLPNLSDYQELNWIYWMAFNLCI
jgi:hypothetical protein